MDTTTWFWICLASTVLALAAAFSAGSRGARKLHLRLAPASLVLLVVTVVMAEQLARERQFSERELAIHLWFARSGGVLAIAVAATGVWLWRTGRGRRLHGLCVRLFLVVTLIAVGTGAWAFSLSTPR
jgi:hypothetical protein